MHPRRNRLLRPGCWLLWLGAFLCGAAHAEELSGRVREADGAPVPRAMVTFAAGDPPHAVTVWSDDAGAFRLATTEGVVSGTLRVRRIGWKDLLRADTRVGGGPLPDLVVERETDPAALAAQLPASRWYALLLERIADPAEREELVRQCTYCHQQGNAATRRVRDTEEWRKLIQLMGRMGGMLSRELREALPAHLNAAYEPASAIPALTARMHEPDFFPPPSEEARRARVDEWELGGRASMQHDVLVHPDGRLYSVDMSEDRLYRLDPAQSDGARASFAIPQGDLPLGGVLARLESPDVPTSNARVGPHSLQVAPDGAVWITLALGNQLARFDPVSAGWTLHPLPAGFYPHTLRFDPRGRIWYTVAASNHVGLLDPASGEHRAIRLPAGSLGQDVVLRAMPFLLWLGRHVDLRAAAADGDGITMPVPYGVDVAPDGAAWVSQLNQHRILRVDPERLAIEVVDTPFPAPRRLRFDSRGQLWIPAFSAGLVARFDPVARSFDRFDLPAELVPGDVPYALNVDRTTDTVWICGTNSDTLIRLEPESRRFTVYPLPTRVTYTREVDFDAERRVWTSNSNSPAWQIEGGVPRVLRLDPDGGG